MEQPTNILPENGRIIIDLCDNGYIVQLPGLSPTTALMDSLGALMPGIIDRVVGNEDADPQMEEIKKQVAAAEKAERPGYIVEPRRNYFVFHLLGDVTKFIEEIITIARLQQFK
jgi:hypothetical protein